MILSNFIYIVLFIVTLSYSQSIIEGDFYQIYYELENNLKLFMVSDNDNHDFLTFTTNPRYGDNTVFSFTRFSGSTQIIAGYHSLTNYNGYLSFDHTEKNGPFNFNINKLQDNNWEIKRSYNGYYLVPETMKKGRTGGKFQKNKPLNKLKIVKFKV